MASTYKDIRKISDGSNVDQYNTNKPIDDLEARTDYLKDQIESVAASNEKTVLTNVPVDDSCISCNVVYFDGDIEKWKPTNLFSSGSETSTEVQLSSSSYAQGVVKNISGGAGEKTGDVYTFGLVNSIISSNILESGLSPVKGVPYYLSAVEDGKITDTPPVTGESFIGKFVSLTDFLFTPSLAKGGNDSLSHTHKWFTLDSANWSSDGTGPGGEPRWLYPASEFPLFPPLPYESFILVSNGIELYYGSTYNIESSGLYYWSDDYDPTAPSVVMKGYYTKMNTDSQSLVSRIAPATDNVTIKSSIAPYEETTFGNISLGVYNEFKDADVVDNSESVIKNLETDETTGEIIIKKGPAVTKLTQGQGISLTNNSGDWTIASEALYGAYAPITDIILLNTKEKILANSTMPYIEYTKNIESRTLSKFFFDLDPKNITVTMVLFGDVSSEGSAVLEIKYRQHNIGVSPAGVETSFNKEILIKPTMQMVPLFTIDKSLIEKNSMVTIMIKRLKNDSYSGNICQAILLRS